MLENFNWSIFIIQAIVVIITLLVIYNLFRVARSLKYEKRLSKFSLISPHEKEISFFEIINNHLWSIINFLSKFFSKSKFLLKSSRKYEKYISYEERSHKKGINYIVIKFLLSLLSVFIYLLFIAVQYFKFNFLFLFLIFIISFFLTDFIEKIKYNRKRNIIEEELYKAIIIMNNAFKSGANILQAIETVPKELDGVIADEFLKIHTDMNYGLSIEESFKRFSKRVELEDANYITASLTILNSTGGNITKIFDTIERALINKRRLRNELKANTAASILIYRLLISIPLIFIIIITILNPSFFSPLFDHLLGLLILTIIVVLYASYNLIIKKVLKVQL